MDTTFYILTEGGTTQTVTEEEHERWANLNAAKFNKVWKTDDGVKEAYLRFVGTKEKGQSLNLFEVKTIFKTYDGEIVNHFTTTFTSYKRALEHFEEHVFLNGRKKS